MAEQFCNLGGAITLCYETFGSENDPPMLLIMGLGGQMILWPDDFCAQLADRGFHVVRFDNRDIGRSTRIYGKPPSAAQLLRRKISPVLYDLGDMADDAAGLLSKLGLAPAHVVGVSMGGMIAQSLAARHPDMVRSLVSIMSMTGSRWAGQPALKIYPYLLGAAPTEREAYIEHMSRMFAKIGSTGLPQDSALIRDTMARSYDRGHDPAGPGRQLGAIVASGDRTAECRTITASTLVIHGSNDPMVSPSGGKATAKAIPGARLMTVEGMGHDLPEAAWPQIIPAIADHAHAADRAAAGAPLTAR
ncbi:MAG TPA: alpha/beta hydrolase [Solirubrobacteraceae bacterium]|nr:alpha/beta hydrolase [Solirubrobacteraceae bacterium]